MRELWIVVAGIGVLGGAGCKKGIDEAGIWAFYLPADSTVECTEQINHNFTGAYVPEEDVVEGGDWTETEESSTSGSLVFAQIEELGDGEALLVVGQEAYPGVATENGWRFSWEGSQDSSSAQEHVAGYQFSETVVGSSTVSILLNVDGDVGDGRISSDTTSTSTWLETDTWDRKQIGLFRGQIPSGLYLVRDDPKQKQVGIPQENFSEDTNCSGDCSLEVVNTCGGASPFTAEHVGYEDEDIYSYLQATGQEAGI